jgi:2'-5' RNA ligase
MKTHHTAVAILPPLEAWDPIQTIRERHDRHIRRWMPHVNVLYPFAPVERFDALEPRLRAACARVTPFEVRLAAFRHFHHGRGRYTMWLVPEPDEPFQELARALGEELPEYDDQFRFESGFTPHLSVGQFRGFEEVRRFKAREAARWRPLSFFVQELSVISRGDPPQDVFRFDREIPLGPAPSGAPGAGEE